MMTKKARETLEDAEILFSKNRFNSSSSRAYYAVFHIMQAVLLTKNLTYKKHSGVISAFSQEFIKIGIFPREFARYIKRLRSHRETGDYSYMLAIDENEAKQDIDIARKFIEKVEEYLKDFFEGKIMNEK
jgi:hypothetical protein